MKKNLFRAIFFLLKISCGPVEVSLGNPAIECSVESRKSYCSQSKEEEIEKKNSEKFFI